MGKRPSQSHLQNRILLYMEHRDVSSLAAFARDVAAHRSSVSRAMHCLQRAGLVSKASAYWVLTAAGREEAQHVRQRLPQRATKAAETVHRLLEQNRLTSVASDATALIVIDPQVANAEAATLNLSAAARESIQSLINSVTSPDSLSLAREAVLPLMHAAAKVDLLTSTTEVIKSLADIVARVDSQAWLIEATQPLISTAASIDLLDSAREAAQSVASVVASVDLLATGQKKFSLPESMAVRLDELVSAQGAIEHLMNSAARFDSLVSSGEPVYSSLGRGIEAASLALAREILQPLAEAATRFDAITLGQDFVRPMSKAMEQVDLLALTPKWSEVFDKMGVGIQTETLAGNLISSPYLSLALDSIKSISLEPSMTEVTASLAFQTFEDNARSIAGGLGFRLAQEALASFSQSQRLSLASIDQVSPLGDAASFIVREFSAANLGLSSIISDLGTITTQGEIISTSMAALMPSVAEVARTYKGYLADVVGGLGRSFADRSMDIGIVVPTRTTSAYISSVRTSLVAEEGHDREVASRGATRVQWHDSADHLDDVFQALGPNYITMWRGAWIVLESPSPDRVRQAAHSARELLMQVLADLAPDSAFDAAEVARYGAHGKVTRKMRVRKILAAGSESAVGWADSVAKALEETYERLAAVSHDRSVRPHTSEQQITGLLYALGGLLSFIDSFRYNTQR